MKYQYMITQLKCFAPEDVWYLLAKRSRGHALKIPLFLKELAILQRGRESLKKAILLFANNSQLVKTNLKKGA